MLVVRTLAMMVMVMVTVLAVLVRMMMMVMVVVGVMLVRVVMMMFRLLLQLGLLGLRLGLRWRSFGDCRWCCPFRVSSSFRDIRFFRSGCSAAAAAAAAAGYCYLIAWLLLAVITGLALGLFRWHSGAGHLWRPPRLHFRPFRFQQLGDFCC